MIELSAKGLVWDLDGTLIDTFKLQKEELTRVLQRRGLAVPPHEVFEKHFHGRLHDLIRDISGADGALLEAICEEFIRAEEHYYEQPSELFFADALKLLRRSRLAGLRQIIISNRPHYHDKRLGSPRNLAQKAPLLGLIDAVVCGDDNEFHKPDARTLNEVERNLGLSRDKLVVIGDQFIDAVLAFNLGCRAILVNRSSIAIPHLDQLPAGWQRSVEIVRSLTDVSVHLTWV